MTALIAMSTAAWSGLSAIGGALVGGLAAGGATFVIDSRRQTFEATQRTTDRNREDARRAAVVRGIARAMQQRYSSIARLFETSIKDEAWPPSILALAPRPSIEDLQVIAGATTAREWQAIVVADSAIEVLSAFHDHLLAQAGPREPGRIPLIPLEEEQRDLARMLVDHSTAARSALDRLAAD